MIWRLVLPEISSSHILGLVSDREPEGFHLDYKRELTKEREEFLEDVTAFANASGGDIIYGIDEERDEDGKSTGLARAVIGLAAANLDQWINGATSWCRDSVEPRLLGVAMQRVEVDEVGPVVVVRVPRSYSGPHVLGSQRSWRIFVRTSAGKTPLKVPEVRAAFLRSESFAERVREFRTERMSAVVSRRTPASLPKGAIFLLHVVPFGAFDFGSSLNVARLEDKVELLHPLGRGVHGTWFNASGFVTASGERSGELGAYLQVFRNGILEHAWGLNERGLPGAEGQMIPSGVFEQYLISAVEQAWKFYRSEGIVPPIVILLSILGAEGCAIPGDVFSRGETHVISESEVLGPELIAESFDVDVARVLRPALDVIWNAAGWPRSPNFTEAGEWKRRQPRR